jgi:general secretion pathway protein E
MGIEPFLIASGVELVIAQRLLRRLCQDCYQMKPIDRASVSDSLRVLDMTDASLEGVTELPVACGCERCRNIGYKGRIGIYEILRVTEALHDPIVRREAAPVMREIGRQGGMVTLGESGWNLACRSLTTLDEVVRTISIKEG